MTVSLADRSMAAKVRRFREALNSLRKEHGLALIGPEKQLA